MPSPLAAQRRTSARNESKTPTKKEKAKVELGQPLGAYDNNLVRDRIRQWQAQGGGVITASDMFVEVDEEKKKDDPPPKTTKRTPRAYSSTKRKDQVSDVNGNTEPSKRQGARQKTRIETEDKDRHRSISAPRKRVVSDGHWRKTRSPPRSTETSSPRTTAKTTKILPDDGIRVRAISDDEPERRVSHKHHKISPKKTYPDDGIRVYSTPPSSRRQSARVDHSTEDETSIRNEVSEDNASFHTQPSPSPKPTDAKRLSKGSTPEKSPRSAKLGTSAANKQDRRRTSFKEKERTADKSPRAAQGGFSEIRESRKSSKGILSHVLDESKKIFSRSEPVVAPSPPDTSRVEAWLSGMPDESDDPFLETEPPVEVPEPLRFPSRRKEPKEELVVEDANKIWDAISTKESQREEIKSRRRRRAHTSSARENLQIPEKVAEEHVQDEQTEESREAREAPGSADVENGKPHFSPSSLRRRGARKDSSYSPKKERRKSPPLKDLTDVEEDEASNLSSVKTASSVEPCEPFMPLKPPGLNIRRPFPSVGKHRLSTIASVETLDTTAQDTTTTSVSNFSEVTLKPAANNDDTSETRDQLDPDSLERRPSKSRLTRHADLISVLSTPKLGSKSIRSARSIRTNRSRLATATIEDLMTELSADEAKYMRELRTLVDGVIPVLLTCVLSRSDSAVAAGLFSAYGSTTNDPAFTKPIIDMGIALERLKVLHKRIPRINPSQLLTWAQGAQRVYGEYLKAWRLGFQDVVVNLAPAADDQKSEASAETNIEGGLPRNEDGDIVDNNGERVDVAFLLKRPLVRLKYLTKTLKGINFINPSTEAEGLATAYQNLVTEARTRSNEERARLEDEAAANIDPTRARDPRTLGPLTGVAVDETRRVRARDLFNFTLLHTSGQRIDCRVELLIRDDAPGKGTDGDVLICEIDGTGRWLLFPPVQVDKISARNGDTEGEIIVMIRGFHSQGQEWSEMLSLRGEDEQTGFEWVQMLGLVPVPPKMMRMQSFMDRAERRKRLTTPASSILESSDTPTTPTKSRTPSPREIEVPFGEQAKSSVKEWIESPVKEVGLQSPTLPASKERSRLQKKRPTSALISPASVPTTPTSETSNKEATSSPKRNSLSKTDDVPHTPKSLNDALRMAGSPGSTLKRSSAKRQSRHLEDSARSTSSPGSPLRERDGHKPLVENRPVREAPKAGKADQRPASPQPSTPTKAEKSSRPSYLRSTSSVPSLDLPIIPKVRKDSPPTTPIHEHEEELEWPMEKETSRTPSSTQSMTKSTKEQFEKPPPPPPHRTPSPVQLKGIQTPDLSAGTRKVQRRSSSPLKHEYEPSTASEESSESDASTVEHNDISSVSESSSEDDDLEDGDVPTPLLPIGALQRTAKRTPPGSIPSLPSGTLGPSSSASQAPYKTVPAQPNKASKTIASIFYWSDKGAWESLHGDECSIVITPGLIEAFEMSSAHSHSDSLEVPSSDSLRSSSPGSTASASRPLIALELTPLVPIRRGTAVDISIRSPPTSDSKIKSITNNNIMFRSRNPEECEALYALINYSRINNPTYIALQNARVTSFTPQFGSAAFNRSQSTRGNSRGVSSWFSIGRRSSYRASSAPTPSISKSESSIGSLASAFSALKRFGSTNSRFSIARSSVTSRNGSRANSSVYTSSSGSGTSTPTPGGAVSLDGKASSAPIGLSNAKIRLYIRETASKWRDLGSARLTIMRPTNAAHPLAPDLVPSSSASSPGTSSSPSAPTQQLGTGISIGPGGGASPGGKQSSSDKRVVVVGKSKGETLLDVTLGESCFERIARTGIAVSVWENFEGGLVAKEGGVGGGRLRVFMIQVRNLLAERPSLENLWCEEVLAVGCFFGGANANGWVFLACR